ncbi:MAG: hypothetical protein HYV97_05080 [Bdellovibrio sp.]|nr:hypothetical protein [Bdellovibrio sp.]
MPVNLLASLIRLLVIVSMEGLIFTLALSPNFSMPMVTTMTTFKSFVLGQIEMPQDEFEECSALLRRMSEDKLKTMKTISQTF